MSATLHFQSALDRIAAERPPLALRLTVLVAAALLVSLIAIASVAQVDIVVTGHGRLAADHATNMAMPLERGVLREVRVRPGDVVHRGDVLAVLDSSFTGADLRAAEAVQRAVRAELARLAAEAAGTDFVPDGSLEGAREKRIFAARRQERLARLSVLTQQIARDAAQRSAALNQIAGLRAQARAASAMREAREALMRRAEGSRLQYLAALEDEARLNAGLQAAADAPGILAHALAAGEAARTEFEQNWQKTVAQETQAAAARLAQADAAAQKAARLQDLVRIVAPEDGSVLAVADRGPGAVLREAEPLLTLLPAHAGLTADVTVKSADIGYVRQADAADIKVDAYPYQLHGTLAARVRSIAAASIDQPDGAAVHRVILSLTADQLRGLPNGVGPIPGMTITADLHVGRRSVLAYFLSPLTRGLAQSFREPG